MGAAWGFLESVGRLLGLLGASWGHLGAKRAPPSGPPSWEPQSSQNRSGALPKSSNFFDCFRGGVLVPLGANLGPTWRPKPSQNPPQLGQKLTKKSAKLLINVELDFSSPWEHFLLILLRSWKAEGAKNIETPKVFSVLLLFRPTYQEEAIRSIFWSTWPSA